MANIKSAKKRILVNERRQAENKFFKTTVNTQTKKIRKLVKEGNLEGAEVLLKETISLINSSASKGIFHKNNASRKISRLSKLVSDAKKGTNVEPVAVETKEVVKEVKEAAKEVVEAIVEAPVKKAAAKKTTSKETADKTPVKKTATKKVDATEKPKTTTAKKTTTKKSA